MVGSASTIDHLPPEIWLCISKLLKTSDLHNLCLINRRLYITVTTDAIWKKRCYDRWINQETLDILTGNDCDPIPVSQWYSYYLQRAKWERKMFSLLQELTEAVSYTHLDVYKRQSLTETTERLVASKVGHLELLRGTRKELEKGKKASK